MIFCGRVKAGTPYDFADQAGREAARYWDFPHAVAPVLLSGAVGRTELN